MKRILIVLLVCLPIAKGISQELNCQVDILPDPKLSMGPVEKEIFLELENSIYDFMNTTKWTSDLFEIEERINCNILITVTDMPSTTTFKGRQSAICK